MALPDEESNIFPRQGVIRIFVFDEPVPRVLRIFEAPGSDQKSQVRFTRAITFRKAKLQGVLDAVIATNIVVEYGRVVVGNEREDARCNGKSFLVFAYLEMELGDAHEKGGRMWSEGQHSSEAVAGVFVLAGF